MSADGLPWRSTTAEFDATGFSLVKRDIEVLMLAVQQLASAAGVNMTGQPSSAAGAYDPDAESITGPRGPPGAQGPQGPAGTIPEGPGGETMSIIAITACVDGVDKTIYVYGYVVP
jgi:hypothetical protein